MGGLPARDARVLRVVAWMTGELTIVVGVSDSSGVEGFSHTCTHTHTHAHTHIHTISGHACIKASIKGSPTPQVHVHSVNANACPSDSPLRFRGLRRVEARVLALG